MGIDHNSTLATMWLPVMEWRLARGEREVRVQGGLQDAEPRTRSPCRLEQEDKVCNCESLR